MTLRLGLFASHGGSNLQAILDACESGEINATAAVVISNNSKSRALARAHEAGVPTAHLSAAIHPETDLLDEAILEVLQENAVDLVVLAGYMRPIGPKVVAAYRHRIVNIHPALLPKHGGQGLFGENVHRSVLESGDTETGPTVHLVDEKYDHGATLAQAQVPVIPGDTVETLSARVLQEEHLLYVQTLGRIASGELKLPE